VRLSCQPQSPGVVEEMIESERRCYKGWEEEVRGESEAERRGVLVKGTIRKGGRSRRVMCYYRDGKGRRDSYGRQTGR
jgi:hypothetical protein